MDGFVDYLSPAHSVQLRKKTWKRRFCRLDSAFRALEVFTDASMGERKHRVTLTGALVATTDEIGALLGAGDSSKAHLSSKIALENSRRCVIRVSERDAATQQLRHHFVCCEVLVPDGSGAVDAHASRQYMQQWLQALKRVANEASTINSSASETRLDTRELGRRIAAYSGRMHLSAYVSGRDVENRHSVFEITVKAWTLQRELVGESDNLSSSSSWEILEYACAWKVRKTLTQLRDFDAQLRQFFQRELRDVVLPSSSSASASSIAANVVHHLLHSAAHAQVESERRVAAMDAYVQQLLCLPAFSAFGSDGSGMLDHFLDISPHLAPLRQLEKAAGQSMHLRTRQVVPWREREQFEQLYRMHLDAAQARSGTSQRARAPPAPTARRSVKSDGERRRTSQQQPRHREYHHRSSGKPHARESRPEGKIDQAADDDGSASPASDTAVRAPSVVEDPQSHEETVHERIAKIGKKLISEAFTASPLHSEPSATH